MQYRWTYPSPLGQMLLAADDRGVTGVWFVGQKDFGRGLSAGAEEVRKPVLLQTEKWLDSYFAGVEPEAMPPLHLTGTPFQLLIWQELLKIPYGATTTYGALARQAACRLGREHMSAQAVGGAVGKNPVSILVPCHRVLGWDGTLTGYAGGMERKRWLLELEKEKKHIVP